MARSESEENSKASFEAFLSARCPTSTTEWCEGEDPPDYYLTFAGETCAVEVLRGPAAARWEGDAERELAELIMERIAVKAAVLQRVTMPKILLLDDQYHFSEPPMYSRVTPVCGQKDFDTIYVYHRQCDGILLTSHLPGLRGVWDH